MGRPSKVSLDAAVKSLVLLQENRRHLVKLRKHLVLAAGHIEQILKIVDQVVEA